MRTHGMKSLRYPCIVLAALLALSGCGYNSLQGLDEQVKGAWGEVQNQYQRRADLIPNLVATVKGAAKFEQETLQKVIEARAAATSVKVDANAFNNPETFKKFEQAQSQLSSSLSRLLVVVEKYPDLKANQNFQNLQAQLEGTENRITVARKRYSQSRHRPTTPPCARFRQNLTAQVSSRPRKCAENFTADQATQKPPQVKF